MHVGLIVAAALLLIAIAFWLVVPPLRGVPRGGSIIVRCRRGHLFTSLWVPGGSLKAVRLGVARFQYCPVGRHWSLVLPVQESSLSPEELAAARMQHDVAIP